MSRTIYEAETGKVAIASYAGPATTNEPTRARLQVNLIDEESGRHGYSTIGFSDAVRLLDALTVWVNEVRRAR